MVEKPVRKLWPALIASLLYPLYFTRWWEWEDRYAHKPWWFLALNVAGFYAVGVAVLYLIPKGLDWLGTKIREKQRYLKSR